MIAPTLRRGGKSGHRAFWYHIKRQLAIAKATGYKQYEDKFTIEIYCLNNCKTQGKCNRKQTAPSLWRGKGETVR